MTDAQKTSLSKIRTSAANLETELKRLDDLVGENGAEFVGENKAKIQAARTNVIMQLKNLYELGAITGPDLPLMEKMIGDPTGDWYDPRDWSKAFNPAGRMKAQTDEMRRIIRESVKNTESGMTGKAPERPPETPRGGPTLAPGQTRPFARGTLTREN